MKATRRNFRCANAILEMAIAFPVLIYMGLGMAEFAQFFYVKNVFEVAARDAARFSVAPSAPQSTPTSIATSDFAHANITFNPSWMTVVNIETAAAIPDVSQIPAGTPITVTISATYSQLSSAYRPLFQMTGKGISSSKKVVGECTAIKE